MPLGPYDHFALSDGSKAPFYILQFDASGRSTSPLTIDHVIEELRSGKFTETYCFSHGWNNTFADALTLYKQFFSGYLDLRAKRNLEGKDYRPLFIGTHWPSIALVLPWERGPKIAGGETRPEQNDEEMRAMIGLMLGESEANQFYKLTERGSLTTQEAQELAGILQRFYSGVADGSTTRPEIEQIVGSWHDLEAAALEAAPDYDAPPGKFEVEILALQWPDINFTELTMRVTRAAVDGVVDEVKTEYSEDDLPLDPDLGTVLLNWKWKCPQSEKGWVFPSPVTGRCYHASPIQQDYIRPAGRKLELGDIGWHTFRHTYRSWLDLVGTTIGVQQKLMRHAQIATTMNVYGNAMMESKREANSKVVQMALRQEVRKAR